MPIPMDKWWADVRKKLTEKYHFSPETAMSETERYKVKLESTIKNPEMIAHWGIGDTVVTIVLGEIEALKEQDVWNEHPFRNREDWRNAVLNEETQLGYWDWLEAEVNAAEETAEDDDSEA